MYDTSARRMTKLQERHGLQPFARRYQVFETRTAATGLLRCQGSRHSQLISRSWTCSCTVTSSVRKHFRCTSSEVTVQDENRAVVASSLTIVLFTHLSCRASFTQFFSLNRGHYSCLRHRRFIRCLTPASRSAVLRWRRPPAACSSRAGAATLFQR